MAFARCHCAPSGERRETAQLQPAVFDAAVSDGRAPRKIRARPTLHKAEYTPAFKREAGRQALRLAWRRRWLKGKRKLVP